MLPRIIEWALENLGVVVVVLLGVFSFLRSLVKAAGNREQPLAKPRPRGAEDPEAAERTRRIQEEIRRKIAERRGTTVDAPAAPPVVFEQPAEPEERRERIPPLVRPREVSPVDPFGGPMRKIIRKIEEAAQEPQWRPMEDAETAAALERQRKLEEQMRALEAARAAEQRRAAELAARRAEREMREATPSTHGGSLRGELRDPQALRRAFVLREVLGTPVGLR